jgi:hypothetical protein
MVDVEWWMGPREQAPLFSRSSIIPHSPLNIQQPADRGMMNSECRLVDGTARSCDSALQFIQHSSLNIQH